MLRKHWLPEATKGQACCNPSCPRWRLWSLAGFWTEVSLAAGEGGLCLFPDFLVCQSCFFTGLGGKFHHLADKSVDREKEGTILPVDKILTELLGKTIKKKNLCVCV